MDRALEILGFLIGLLYLWWEYHADRRMWFASIVMPAISMWIYFRKGIYADFAMNIYYLAIAVYGYLAWTGVLKRRSSDDNSKQSLPITHIGGLQLAVCALGLGVLWSGIYYVLAGFTDSTVPLYDSFTTALSFVAMWMLARKYVEQWFAWVLVDMVCIGLYAYKGIYFYAVLYAVYTVIAFFGYAKWMRIMRAQHTN